MHWLCNRTLQMPVSRTEALSLPSIWGVGIKDSRTEKEKGWGRGTPLGVQRPPHLPSGPWSHHKWPLNLGLINAIKGTSILLLARFEVKHRCHLLPAQPWVSSSREGDNIIGVVVVRPLLLGAQAAEHVAQVKGGAVTPRVAGVADIGFSGRALEVRQGGVR